MMRFFYYSALSLVLSFSAGHAHAGLDGLFGKVDVATDIAKAATVSDQEIIDSSRQMMAMQDKKAKVAPAGNKYADRLTALTAKHTKEDGLKLNFKVYISPAVNAFATPDGSIRVYSGLMDMMNDDELRGIIGHEIGHTKLGHSVAAVKTAYMASAGRKAAASSKGALGKIAESDLGDMFESILNAQFSQTQETASDDYGFQFLKKHKYNLKAMESAFRKFEKLDGGKGSITSSHPGSGERADRMKAKAGDV